MRAPTNLSRKHLQNTNTHGKMVLVWKAYAKGGHFDSYGLSYSRGGCKRTQILNGYSQEDATQARDAWVQNRQGVARRQGCIRGVVKATRKSVQETGSGGLTPCVVFSVTAQSRLITIGTRLNPDRCKLSPHVYYSQATARTQQIGHVAQALMGYGVAGGVWI